MHKYRYIYAIIVIRIKMFLVKYFFVIYRKIILLLIILSLIISCNSFSDDFSESFDILLINKYENLHQKGNYEEIMKVSREYLKYAKEKKYKDGEALCYTVMASADVRFGNYKKVLPFFIKAKTLLNNSENSTIKSFYFNEYARLHLLADLYALASDYNNRAIDLSKKIKDKKTQDFQLNKAYLLQGGIMDALNKNDSALHYFHKALKIKNTPIGAIRMAQHHLFYTKNIDSIAIYTSHALSMLNLKNNSLADACPVYSIAGAYYREVGDLKKSKDYHMKALKILDDMPGLSKSIYYIYVYADLATLADREKNQKEKQYYYAKVNRAKENIDWDKADMTNKLNENYLLETKAKNKKNIIFYIILLLIIFLILLYFIYRRIKLLKWKKEFLESDIRNLEFKINDNRFDEIMHLARKNDPGFILRFAELNPDFNSKLQKINPELEKSELVFAAMIKMNFSSKELAQNLGIQHSSVQKRKNRIRKRLNIPGDTNIYDFFDRL